MGGVYLLYGMAFSYHITTHEYYSIPLIPAIALSLAPLAGLIFDRITRPWITWPGGLWSGFWYFRLFYSGWMGRSILLGKNYRNEAISLAKDGPSSAQTRAI